MAVIRSRRLDLGTETPDAARVKIKTVLTQEPEATGKIYAGLAHKVWSLLVERRLDAEIRDWHGLLLNVKTAIQPRDEAAAERIAALGDLLRESISLAETSPAKAVAQRPQARRILQMLRTAHGFVPRRQLLETLRLGNSHLSNILTQLAAHSLIERLDRGKEALFKITPLGRQLSSTTSSVAPDEEMERRADLFRKLAAEADRADASDGGHTIVVGEFFVRNGLLSANDQHIGHAGARSPLHDWHDQVRATGTRARSRIRSATAVFSEVHT